MTISVWRYSHLALAISSFLIIILASLTGIILAFEPISIKQLPYKVGNFNEITLDKAVPAIKENFDEVSSVIVDAHQFVVVKGIDKSGADVTVYINPNNGKTLGVPAPQSEFFQWITALHRSLFLHEAGRFIIGLTTFLLLLITVSGSILIIQRQRGIKKFFTKIVRENFYQYYHVTLGRLLLIPILIITISGTYLSLVRFKVIPEEKVVNPKIDFDALKTSPELKLSEFKFFKETPLSAVQSIDFPFSEDVEDYYTFKLTDKEVSVNQITGDVIAVSSYPFTTLMSELSLDLHTGRTNSIWSVILAFACLNILFFIYSGFAITLKRIKGNVKNRFNKDECEYIILVGSENGTTNRFAKAMYQQLLDAGKKCFLTELNNYTVFENAKHLLVFAATYGLGDPTTNANKFLRLLKKFPQPNNIDFSVLGFGSQSYPDFCKFAYEIENALIAEPWAKPWLEIHTINDKSPEEFAQWVQLWSQKTEIPITIDLQLFTLKPKQLKQLIVTEKTEVLHQDGSFLIHLKPKRSVRFKSGDLLAVYPAGDHRERLYSIGRVNKALQLSVKLHEDGLGSNYLYNLKPGQIIKASINNNAHFHLPKNASPVIMICNGTGIAPFLGMIAENENKVDMHLYCGFRAASSFKLYEQAIAKNLSNHQLTNLNLALSREGDKQYVSDLVLRDQELLANAMENNGVIMICGSLAMQKDVTAILEVIFKEKNKQTLAHYQSHHRILMDCY